VARLWWTAFATLCIVLVAPLFVTDMPPLVDYPNHLARLFVLAALPDDPVLARFFAPHWSIIPNLALDLIGPPLMHILPVHVVGRALVAVAVLLPVLGTVAYNTALGGRWWSLGVGLVAYNACLLYGFLNFQIAIGLGFLLAACWLRWREPRPARAVIIAAAGAPILFACHLMGLVLFAALIGGAELYQVFDARHRVREAIGRGAALALIFATPAVLYAVSDLRDLGGDAVFLSPAEKLEQLVNIFTGYIRPLDMLTAAAAIGMPVLCVVMRWGKVPGRAAVPMLLLLVAFLAAPYAWKSTYLLDTRLAIMLAFMLFAGFVPGQWPNRWRLAMTAGLVLVFSVRMAVLTVAWSAHQADIDDLRQVLVPVKPGQAVYVASVSVEEAPEYWAANPAWRRLSDGFRTDVHMGAMVLLDRRAWWPYEFDVPSQQPIETLQPYKALTDRLGNLPAASTAAAADVCGYDHVLITNADALPDLPADRFRLESRSGYAALYAITRCGS
jgi:hypothetical protein